MGVSGNRAARFRADATLDKVGIRRITEASGKVDSIGQFVASPIAFHMGEERGPSSRIVLLPRVQSESACDIRSNGTSCIT
jgi:hypothetical protein